MSDSLNRLKAPVDSLGNQIKVLKAGVQMQCAHSDGIVWSAVAQCEGDDAENVPGAT